MPKKTLKNVKELEDLPNIGKSIAGDLRCMGIYNPCVLNVFMSAISFVHGNPAKPWWRFTKERKRRMTTQ